MYKVRTCRMGQFGQSLDFRLSSRSHPLSFAQRPMPRSRPPAMHYTVDTNWQCASQCQRCNCFYITLLVFFLF